ncbi:MAG: DsrE family protein [Bacteroidota bacterium]
MNKNQSVVIQVNSDGMGVADKELKTTLIKNYFKLLNSENQIPFAIVFYASGVNFVCTGSEIIEDLKIIESKGVKILACKTCLNFYNIADKVETGIIATMIDIIDIQFSVEKIINL